MNAEELSKLTDDELERRIADARPNQYVPGSIYHAFIAEREKRRHNSILQALTARERIASGRGKKKVSQRIIKALFVRSRNMCYFQDCSTELVNDHGVVTGQIAHIEGEKPGGPRYNNHQSDEERFGYENLILLCPNHHTLIDKDPNTYTVEILRVIKLNHESKRKDVIVSVFYAAESRSSARHEYQLKVVVNNNSGKTLYKPTLAIILPNQVLGSTSFRAKKTLEGKMVQVYFDELDISEIHPGEEKVLMETSNVGLYYFMDSNLHDDNFVMNQELTVKLFADSIEPIVVSKPFKEMQEF